MKKEFKKFLITVFTVIIILMSLDFTFGKVMDWMLPQISNQGDTGKTYFSLNEVNTPIVIVGSSRASHHYVTQMIEDSLGMPAYNVGRDGCFFSYNCCVVNSILDRYSPKLIIWENYTQYLNSGIDDPLENLYPYYSNNINAHNILNEELPWTERIKICSNFYKYNSLSHRVLMRYFSRHNFVDGTIKGYLPIPPKELKSPLIREHSECLLGPLSNTKINRFISILSRIKERGIELVIVNSPEYSIRNNNDISSNEMKRLCLLYGAHFVDNSQMPFFLDHPEYFCDNGHLNASGAKIYTEMFLTQLNIF